MIPALDVAVILLAAGQSRRFGSSSKLSAPFRDKPLALHAAEMLSGIAFGERICVRSDATGPVAGAIAALGFRLVEQANPQLGLSSSLALGVEAALCAQPQAVLIALADMPLVPRGHIMALLDAFGANQDLIASSDGRVAMPPALFGRRHFESLLRLTGDVGARRLLADARRVEAAPGELFDIDRPEDFVAEVGRN